MQCHKEAINFVSNKEVHSLLQIYYLTNAAETIAGEGVASTAGAYIGTY